MSGRGQVSKMKILWGMSYMCVQMQWQSSTTLPLNRLWSKIHESVHVDFLVIFVNPAWHYTWGISLFYVPLTKKTCYCMLASDQIKVSQTKLMSRYYDNQTSISMSPVNWHGQLKLTNQSLLKLWNQGYQTCMPRQYPYWQLFFPTSASF